VSESTTSSRPQATAHAAVGAASGGAPAWAKGALRRLAQQRLEPTPENYARAYAEESGQPLPTAAAPATAASAPATAAPLPGPASDELRLQGTAWAALVDRLARNLDRGGRQWTSARRKDSLQRVLTSSRSDPQRLLQRLQSLLGAWETDRAADAAETGLEEGDGPGDTAAPAAKPITATAPDALGALPAGVAAANAGLDVGPHAAQAYAPVVDALQTTVRAGLPTSEPRAAALADELAALADVIAAQGATPEQAEAVAQVCERARRLFNHRHHLVDELAALCRQLAGGLTELAEDDSWARGQCASLQARLAEEPGGPSVRAVRAATELLAETRQRQQQVRGERNAARDALKHLLARMLSEVGELGEHAGRFQAAVGQHAQAIARADTLESLAGVVQQMLDDSHAVQSAVSESQQRLGQGQSHAHELEARVRELEGELRRLSDEVSTDALTQVANRRGLASAFEAESARATREAAEGGTATLAVALIDIDNFKKLNDSLGHAAGDEALKSLAQAVRERLRPVDHLARFGGEEFVLLLPGTALDEAQQALSRLQRSLTASLFMHEGKDVFVTFSAGVTAWRTGEALAVALERADEALYEAKRTGKNRTCVA
jgi:diguanylate cyclase